MQAIEIRNAGFFMALLVVIGCVMSGCEPSSQVSDVPEEPDPNIVVLDQSNFGDYTSDGSGLLLVDFWASWCGPCKIIAPTVSEIAAELKGEVSVGKVDVDKNGSLSRKYDISGIPALLLFKDGQLVWRVTGVVGKNTILKAIEEHRPTEKDV